MRMNKRDEKDIQQNFVIGIGRADDGSCAIQVVIEDIESEEKAKVIADAIAKWLTEESGWMARVN